MPTKPAEVVPQEQGQALEVVDVTLPDPGPNQVVAHTMSEFRHSQLHTIDNLGRHRPYSATSQQVKSKP